MTVKQYYVRMDSTNYKISSFEYKKKGNEAIDVTTIYLARSEDSTFSIGDDISVGYLDAGDSFVAEFNGDIVSKELHEELVLTMESYGGRLNRVIVSEIYEDKSPEYIVQDLVDNNTTLTYASSGSSGATISRFVINDETIGASIQKIVKEVNWQIRVDNSKNLYFEPKGDVRAGVDLTLGTNAFMESNWKEDPNQLINEITIIGDKASYYTDKTINASASQTVFTVNYKIVGNVKVTVDGTEKTGGQEGSIGTYDYTVKKEQKQIVFEVAMSGGESVVIYYEYEANIKVVASNSDSVALYGKFPKKVTDTSLKTMDSARKFARRILATYSEPIKSAALLVTWDMDIDVGETTRVVDSFNSVDEDLVVTSLVMKYPEGTKTVNVGVKEMDLLNWNKNMDERVKNLEDKQNAGDMIQKFLSFPENINVTSKHYQLVAKTRAVNDSFVMDSYLGELNNDVVGDKSDAYNTIFTKTY